ncbi:MAG: bifunctional diguanylate cyclase/phosphodiesterase [Burkholderiales bacterium PBB5]|nr:MAG: bifunctional diguanylate cyclase/phosphodiesterase [Burkholderiales bacterium PBB5]
MSGEFLSTRHDPWLVLGSVLLACFAAYVTLDMARRVREHHGAAARWWWASGALVMGTGVWATHFVGMLAFDAGLQLGYARAATALSWLAAVAAAGVALDVGNRPMLTRTALAAGALAMTLGIISMHYLGMAAIDLAPGIVWRWPLVALSVAVALAASAAALALLVVLRRVPAGRRVPTQLGAAGLMGGAICGTHYTGMAAVQLPLGVVCRSLDQLGGEGLGLLVGCVTALILTLALIGSAHDSRQRAREARLARSLQSANAQLQSANAELQQLAFRDVLTGLPNRLLFDDRLQHAIDRLQRQPAGPIGPQLAVLFIDLDGFKPVNDALGHGAGDLVLREAARRLAGVARASDTLARVGGDEFVLLAPVDPPATATALAERLIEALRRPFALDGQSVALGCSIGIAQFPEHGAGDRLLACADAAMYAAKRAGGGGWAMYQPGMGGNAGEQAALQQALRVALARGELSLHYQPKVHAASGAVQGLEALLRWHHPERGMVSPAVFIPVAERCGLIGQIGQWVIDEACAQLARWRDQGWHGQVAVNLSPHQLRQPELVARVLDALARHALQPTQLALEVTETAMMENLQADGQVLARLSASGVTIAIDDFGTGYSSLAYLRRLPARELKIDRSFVQDVDTDSDARAVMQAVVGLAHALRMQVVAEGVETVGQRTLLTAMGCDLLQGYLLARPMPAEAVLPWLAAQPRPPGPQRCAA